MDKHTQNRSNEQGVALLMTLGILALLMMLAISFAVTARTDRRAANVSADLIRARLLAESGLERAMGYLSYGHDPEREDEDDEEFIRSFIYPGTGYMFDGWQGHRIMVSSNPSNPDQNRLQRAMSINLGFDYTPPPEENENDYPFPQNASWHHITNADDELVGRIAFLVIDESGKIDPNLATWNRELTEWDGEDPPPDPEGQHPHYYNNRHFNQTDINYSYTFSPHDINDFIPPPASTINRWFSWFHLNNGISGLNTNLLKYRLFPWSYAKEKFLDFDPGEGEEWHEGGDSSRFNLRREDWNNVAFSTVRNIPWINQIIPPSDDISDLTTSRQVAANLIAYSRSAGEQAPTDLTIFISSATSEGGRWDDEDDWSDTEKANWPGPGFDYWPLKHDADRPSAHYIGRIAAPYINEVAIDAELELNTAVNQYELTLDITPEMINIYEDGLTSGNLTLLLRFKANGEEGLPEGVTTDPSPGGQVVNFNRYGAVLHWENLSVGDNSYGTGAENTLTYRIPPPSPENGNGGGAEDNNNNDIIPPLELDNFTIEAFALFRDPGNVLVGDLANMGEITGINLEAEEGESDEKYINFSATDPRANTYSPHWDRTVDDNDGIHTLGSVNQGADPTNPSDPDNADIENVTDPADGVSTAFIRHAPMESLWELGAIHRGEPWQTLNLTAFNDGSEERTWEHGDAAILDQVKLTSQNTSYYRVNINSPNEQALRSLFEGIRIRSPGYDHDPTEGDGPLNMGDGYWASERVSNIVEITETEPFINRGQIAEAQLHLPDTSFSTQREKEEVIGKIAHLLTTRQNFFRIVVTAQAVRDLGEIGIDLDERNVIEYDSANNRWCRILAEQKIMAIVYRDAFNNTYNVIRYEYLDD